MPIAHPQAPRSAARQSGEIQAAQPFTAGSDFAARARLIDLLASTPIDLAGISNEIRHYPTLESLVIRLSSSLVLLPEAPLATVEEAVVVLGTDRLRVVIDLWVATPSAHSELNSPNEADPAGTTAKSPEARYIANFLRSFGFESADELTQRPRLNSWAATIPPDRLSALTDLFMRDFFSLLPAIQPESGQSINTASVTVGGQRYANRG